MHSEISEVAQTQGPGAAFANVLAFSPVLHVPDQQQTPPHISQEQTLLLSVVSACHVILVETERLLRMPVRRTKRNGQSRNTTQKKQDRRKISAGKQQNKARATAIVP
jgi:hypothetical protein